MLDDADFDITHVVRGDDHLPNTPRQMQIFFALGLEPPAFAHLPMVMGPDGQKLSKRHGATSVFAYRDAGYFPEALLNYLARLGWSHGDQEIFSKKELIEYFGFEACGKSAGIFNAEKLLWLNFHYMKERPLRATRARDTPVHRTRRLHADSRRRGVARKNDRDAARARQDAGRTGRFREVLPERCDITIDPKAAAKFFKPEIAAPLSALARRDRIRSTPSLTRRPCRRRSSACWRVSAMKLGQLAQPVRVALTGGTVSPGIYEVIAVLGKARTVARLRAALERVESTV